MHAGKMCFIVYWYAATCFGPFASIVRVLYKNTFTDDRQIVGSIPDGVIGIFQLHNPSGRTMALGSTQSLTEMSTKFISWG